MPLLDSGNFSTTTAIVSAAACLTSAAVAAGVTLSLSGQSKKVPKKWIRVGSIKSLHIFPIKGCHGIEVEKGIVTKLGLQVHELLRDRIFVIVDNRGFYQVQKNYSKLALIEYSVDLPSKRVTLKAPGVQDITFDLPEDTKETQRKLLIFEEKLTGLHCGDAVSNWLQTFIGGEAKEKGLHLIYHGQLSKTQRNLSNFQKQFATTSPADLGTYQNYTSYLLIADESVKELNKHLKKAVTFENFRPTILINQVLEPFSEIKWTFVRIGENTILKSSKPCERCSITTVDQNTGVRDPAGEPLKTLTKLKPEFDDKETETLLKNRGIMGLQMGLFEDSVENAEIRVGDPIYVALF